MAMFSLPTTPFTAVIAGCVLALSIWVIQTLSKSLTSPLRHLPGPWYTHLTHLRLKLAVITGRRTFYIHSLHAQYGPIVRLSPFEIAVCDVGSFQKIHKIAGGGGYTKSPWYQKFADLPKHGVFTLVENKEHAARRRVLARPFSRSYLGENWEGVVRGKCEMAVRRIREEAVRGEADAFVWWKFMASDVMSHLAFGESFRNLEMGKEAEFVRKLDTTTMGGGICAEMPLLRYLKYIPIGVFQDLFNGNEYVLKIANKAVEIAKTRKGESNLFAKIIEDRMNGEGTMDDDDVSTEAVAVLVAGSDTTSVTLSYLLWMVLQRPDMQAKLEAEAQTLQENFSEMDVLRLPLLNAVIEETLRLYGAAPGSLPRVVPAEGAELCGHFVPGGTTVSTQAWTMHRDPTIWRNPLDFDPTRWLTEPSPAGKIAYHPFGAGARACLGIHIARMELRYATAFFFRECRGARLAAKTTPESMEPVNFFLIAPKSHHCYVTMA